MTIGRELSLDPTRIYVLVHTYNIGQQIVLFFGASVLILILLRRQISIFSHFLIVNAGKFSVIDFFVIFNVFQHSFSENGLTKGKIRDRFKYIRKFPII